MGFLKDYRKYMEISRYQKVTKKMFGHKFDRLSEVCVNSKKFKNILYFNKENSK